MTTEYEVRLDRAACDGVFACLVRDDRFAEGPDGLATVDGVGEGRRIAVAAFDDDRIEDARQAACACPVNAIEIAAVDGGGTEGTHE